MYLIKEGPYNCKIYYQDKKHEQLINNVMNVLLKKKQEDKGIELIKERLTADKDGKNRNVEVYRYVYQAEKYYIKHFYQRRLSKRIIRFIRGPQGLNNFKTAMKFQESSIPCAVPVACIVYKTNVIDYDSISICKGVDGLNLLDTLKTKEKGEINISNRMKVARQLGEICSLLVNNNYLHKDPNPQNFICTNIECPSLCLIDFDDIYHFSYLPLWQVIHFLARISAKFYVWFVLNGLMPPSYQERKAFIKAFFRKTNREINYRGFMDRVNKLTVKKILSRADKSILQYDQKIIDLLK